MKDIIIIGGGPAGISAALYAVRAGLDTRLFFKDGGALARAGRIDNYFGISDTGAGLLERGRAQAAALGVDMTEKEITALNWNGAFTVTGDGFTDTARAILLASGAARKTPSIPGIKDFEGSGVSYCAVCDGFFFKGKKVAVLGSGEYALHELSYLSQLAEETVLLTNGAPAPQTEAKVITARLNRLFGQQALQGAETDAGKIFFDGLFIAEGMAGAAELARNIGIQTENGAITADASGVTGVPGLFAAGDCTGDTPQVSTAVGAGAKAALSAIAFIKEQKKHEKHDN